MFGYESSNFQLTRSLSILGNRRITHRHSAAIFIILLESTVLYCTPYGDGVILRILRIQPTLNDGCIFKESSLRSGLDPGLIALHPKAFSQLHYTRRPETAGVSLNQPHLIKASISACGGLGDRSRSIPMALGHESQVWPPRIGAHN